MKAAEANLLSFLKKSPQFVIPIYQRTYILDTLWQSLPRPPFTDEDAEVLADRVYDYVWQRSSTAGTPFPSVSVS